MGFLLQNAKLCVLAFHLHGNKQVTRGRPPNTRFVGIRGAGPARKGRRGHEWWRLGLQTHGEVHVIYAAYM